MARVLVIDDEPDVLLLCRVNLERAGHEVLEAPDGEQGLALARSGNPDLIVLDVMLPRMDGFEVLATLGASEATKHVPVVMLSAKAQVEDQLRGWTGGASGYVTKPFSPAALTLKLAEVHSMSALDRERVREEELARLHGVSYDD